MGIFEDVRLELEPGKDNPREAVVVVNVIEKTTGSLAFGGGVSSAAGLFGTLSYQEVNLGGNNQRLGAELEAGNRVFQMDLNFTDPWIAGDPYRTSYSVNAFRRRTISVVFENGPKEVYLANGDRPRVVRTGGGISFTRPYADNVFLIPIGSLPSDSNINGWKSRTPMGTLTVPMNLGINSVIAGVEKTIYSPFSLDFFEIAATISNNPPPVI